MSYLDLPRIHLYGQFFANPSTINNTDSNYNPNLPIIPSWNPQGQALWKLSVAVQAVMGEDGTLATSGDTLIGAELMAIPNSNYAKLVDLDPDNQSMSQVFGLTVQLSLPSPDPDNQAPQVLFTGTVDPCALTDLWMTRVVNTSGGGDPCASGAFQSVINVTWQSDGGSAVLQTLQAMCPEQLSIKWVVDGFNPNLQSPGFGYGRMVATIGPVTAGEPAHFIPGRRLNVPDSAPIFSNSFPLPMALLWYGQGQVKERTVNGNQQTVLTLDLGNSVAIDGTPGGSPLQFPSPIMVTAGGTELGTIDYTLDAYQNQAGIFDLVLNAAQASAVASNPITLSATPPSSVSGYVATVAERSDGVYVNMDLSFSRLDWGVEKTRTVYSLAFGAPQSMSVDLELNPPALPATGLLAIIPRHTAPDEPPPEPAPFPITVSTGPDGTALVQLRGGNTYIDPQTQEKAPGRKYIDGQVYWVNTSTWSSWLVGMSALHSALVFQPYSPATTPPTWDDVQPIMYEFARLYPGMRSILDISDYNTVKANASAMTEVLSLPVTDPNYMPVTRDLSEAKRSMVLSWLAAGCPAGTTGASPSPPPPAPAPSAAALGATEAVPQDARSNYVGPVQPWTGANPQSPE